MLTDLQHLLLGNSIICWLFDIIYVGLPVLLTIAVYKDVRSKTLIAICTAAFSLIYGSFISAVCYMSPELFVGFIFIPILFSTDSLKTFYYYLHCLRFLFILIFVSAGLWKIKQAGLFNIEEMAGILLYQHNGYIISNDHDWYTRIIYSLIQYPAIAYLFYFIGTCIELLFVAGLFTRKFDTILIVAFFLFILFDLLLMRINYFSWTAFMGCFYFSKFHLYDDRNDENVNVSA